MQKIRVNNKIFRSMAEAARFLHIPKATLFVNMKNKKAITYKDLLIEKVDESKEPKEPKTKPRKKGIPVLVDGVLFDNCAAAERAIGCASSTVSDALRRGAKNVFGHKVEALYPSMLKTPRETANRHGKSTKVKCITTGVIYRSINEAAIAANCDSWTMGKKMEASGGFVDACGNEYQRLTPMITKNNYADTGKTVQFKKSYTHREPNKGFVAIDESLIMAQKPGEPLFPVVEKEPEKVVKAEIPQIVKDAINDKIVQLLKDKEIYNEIIELLNYGGFSTIKIKKDDD